jgi:hypothetical protein
MKSYEVFLIITFVSLAACVVFATKAIQMRKPGRPLQPSLMESPFNYLFRPSELTEAGLRARKKCFFFGIVSLILLAATIWLAQ